MPIPILMGPEPGPSGNRRGFRRVQRPQDARPVRHRGALRQAGSAERATAVPHRRIDDHDGDPGLDLGNAGSAGVCVVVPPTGALVVAVNTGMVSM